jgi:hypothetical protein
MAVWWLLARSMRVCASGSGLFWLAVISIILILTFKDQLQAHILALVLTPDQLSQLPRS